MKHKGVLSVVIGFVGIAVIAAVVVITKMESHRFYYPDRNYQKLRAEWRDLRLESYGRTYEEMLVREYLLGPVDYRLRLDIDPDTLVLNVWLVNSNQHNQQAVIVNFGGDFSNNVVFNNESYGWMVKGLLKTLRANTQVKSLYILAYGKRQNTYLGDYNIDYPILVDQSGF